MNAPQPQSDGSTRRPCLRLRRTFGPAFTAVGVVGALKWTFSGSLQPGGSGTVTYTVNVDQ